ncbi:MAG TPA: amino acid adenylation domain-containing protein [Thermoanaerobaculia bacterium]
MQHGAGSEEALTPGQKRELLRSLLRRKTAEPRIAGISLEQRRLFTLYQLDPESSAYNLLSAYQSRGRLDVPALRRGLGEIVRRHEALRTVFSLRDGEPVQEVREPSAPVFGEVDLRALPDAGRRSLAREIATREARRPFDLTRGPLCRFYLLRLADDEHLLLMVLHHIVTDVWSFKIFNDELTVLYRAYHRGEASPLEPLSGQHGDFSAWERRQFTDQVLESEMLYWKRALAGMEVTELASDFPRPPIQTHNGAIQALRFPEELPHTLRRIARERDVSLFMASLAVFQVLLHRYTGASDVNCGIPVSNRDTTAAEKLIGFFVNTVVVRTDLSANPSFATVLDRVQAVARGVYAHCHLPFDRLVEKLKPHRDSSRNPLFQITFQMGHLPPLELEGLAVAGVFEQDYGIVRCDLELCLGEEGRAIVVYNRDLYRPDTIAELGRRFQMLWEGVVAAPERPIGDLPMMSEAEQHNITVEWNDTAARHGADRCIHEWIEAQAESNGEALAAVCEAVAISYGDLNRRANRLAHWLRERGVRPEVPVGVRLERSLDGLVAFLAILKAGGAHLPLSRQQPPERLAAILADSGTRLVLAGLDSSAPELAATREGRSFVDLFHLDLSAYPDTNPVLWTTADNLAYMIYTSGSSGTPKGVLIEHRSAMHLAHAMDRLCYPDLAGRKIRVSLNAPTEFDASMQQIVMLTRGHCLVIIPEETRLDGPAFVRYLARHQVEALDCTPSHLAVLIDAGLLDEAGGSLRKILAAGGAIDRRMWNRLAVSPRIQSYDIYGPTECTVNATGHAITAADEAPRIGTPLENYTVYLLDPHLRPVPNGVVGEIFIGGEGVARGYLARPDLTACSFLPNYFGDGDRLYRTGDHARRLGDGALEFLGRRDDQVKIRGFRIELGEIQASLIEHEAVRQAAVVAHGEADDKLILAYVVPEEAGTDPVERIRDDLRCRLPDAMIPSRFILLADLPLTPSGKLDRAALPHPKAFDPAAAQARSVLEEGLLEIWAEAFDVGRSEIGIDSSFFELGGHSLLAVQITSRIRDLFQIDLKPRTLFSHSTPRDLAKVFGGLRGTAAAAFPPIGRTSLTSPPLSFAQERIWFLDQMEPGLAAYNIPIALRLTGALNRRGLAASFDHFVRRHEALRTSFTVVDGQPAQRIMPAQGDPMALPVVDLSGLCAARREVELLRLGADDGARGFRLDTHPLYRITLLHLGPAEHVLLLCLHHAIIDAWSIRILMKELGALYESFLEATPLPLPALAVTYADYAVWQRNILHEEAIESQTTYWRARLDRESPVLSLPTDRPRPAAFRYRGGNVFFEIPAQELSSIAAAALAHGVTVFVLLTAAVQLLLARYSGEEDIWLGSPVANRNQRELEDLVGLFLNMVVLRGDLHRSQSVRDLLQETRSRVFDASDHQDLPFERLVETLNPDRSLSYSPLFQCMLTFQRSSQCALDLNGVSASMLRIENATAKLDLTFDLSYSGERLEGRIEYDRDLFDVTTVLRMEGSLQKLLHQMAVHPETALGELSLLGSSERFQLTCEWNDTRAPCVDVCIHELFTGRVVEDPDRTAVVSGEASVSYGDLNRRANGIAHFLLSRGGAGRGGIGVCMRRSVDLIAALLGVLKAGRAYVPIEPAYPSDRILNILRTSGAELVLTDSASAERLRGLDVELVALDRESFVAYPETDPGAQASPQDLAYVIFTSGSTGHPKGVVLQHRPVVNLISWVNRTFGIGEGDGLLFVTSPCFDLSVYDIFGTLAAGATIYVANDETVKDPELLVELLYGWPITFWDSAPAALARLQPLFDSERARESRLRLVFLSGDWIPLALTAAVAEVFPRALVVGLGGATEAAIWSNFFPLGEIGRAWKSIPYGRPIQNARYYILDPALQPCPLQVAGDLYIGGDCLSIGYLKEPILTARQFVPDPFAEEPGAILYATGDRASWGSDGNIEFLGRLDAQVKVRGFRIELGEIESVLESHEAVLRAVVLAREDRLGDRRLVAYVQERATISAEAVPRMEHSGEEPFLLHEELLRLLRSKLPEYMIPGHFVVLEQWPVTVNGKLDRKALPAPRTGAAEDAFVPAESLDQETLAQIWAAVLGLERVGIYENFFALGGDSILAIQIVARANQMGLRVRPRDFFQAQTVAAMLPRALKPTGGAERWEPEVQEAALTPIQRWFFAQEPRNPHHFNQAVLLEWKDPLDVPRLLEAMRQLCADHDALRLRFFESASGWRQAVRPAGAEGVFAFTRVDLEGIVAERGLEALDQVLEDCATQIQGSLRITGGSLFAACLFDTGVERPQLLLLVAHHLSIDGVSWRVLLEDLVSLYDPSQGRGSAPGRSDSWMRWAGRLDRQDLVDEFRAEEAFWSRQARRQTLQLDFPGGENRASSTATVVGRLSGEETELLERRVPDVYRTSTVDILLAALTRTFEDGSESPGLTIDLEAHGRSHELGDGDLVRTVGWFTTLYPVSLDVDPSAPEGTRLKALKEQLRAVPREGVGYGVLRHLSDGPASRLARIPRPEILFNYLGRFGQALVDHDLFRVRTEPTGQDVGTENERTHLLEINSLTLDGVFETRWRFSRNLHRVSTVERYVERFMTALRRVIRHCLSPEAGGRTPSDFPLARVGQAELDLLVARHPDLEDLYPATALQQGMLFHGELAPEVPIYVQQISLDVLGNLDVEALREAWATALVRHSCLRTVFVIADGVYLQGVLSARASFWSFEDWRGVAAAERGLRLERFLEEDLRRRFKTAEEPPFRVSVVRLEEEIHHLVVTFHHAILDGWSLSILLEEISALYEARTQGRQPALPVVPPPRDYAVWLAELDASRARVFWQPYLKDFRKPDPLGRSASPTRADRGQRSQRTVMPGDLVARLERYCRSHRLTQSTVLQAAWAILIGRSSGASDIVVGATLSGREQGFPGIERMCGLFINTLPLRVAVDEDVAVDLWLQGVQGNIVEIRQLAHSSLTEIQASSEVPPGQALFEAIVVVENYPFSEALMKEWLGHGVENLRSHERANYPLSLLVELRLEVALEIRYDAGRFDDLGVCRMLQQLQTLLGAMAQGDAPSVAGLEMLSEAEWHQLVREANDSRDDGASSDCLHAMVERQAEATPDRVAVAAGGDELCFADLVDRFDRLARSLRYLGVGPEDRVGLSMERSVEAIVAILAIMKVGAAYVPVDLEYPPERIELMLRDSGARWVVTQGPALASRLSGLCPEVRVLDLEAPGLPEADPAPGFGVVDPGQPAYVIYTSGSTGRPKGVVVEHRSVAVLLNGMRERVYGRYGDDGMRLAVNAPFAFDASMQQIVMLACGHSLHVVPAEVRTDGAAFVDFLAEERIEGLDITPSHLGLLLEAGLLSRTDLALKCVVVAGGAVDPRLWTRLADSAGARFFNIYGPTEATINATGRLIEGRSAVPSIGRPLANYCAYVLDSRLRPVPLGVAGQLFLGGRGLAQGYHARPGLTAERFLPDPFSGERGARFYQTGDLVRTLDSGELEFLGRIDYQVKIRGFRVELGEIESVLLGHEEVSRAVVVLDQTAVDARLVAFYTTSHGGDLPREDLRAFARRSLPGYMVPNELVKLESIPLLANGKVARAELPKAGAGTREGKVTARNRMEERVAEMWSEVLGVDAAQVGVCDDFLSLGGHSLNAVLLLSRMQRELGTDLSLKSLYEGTTISEIAVKVAAGEEELLESERAAELLGDWQSLSEEQIRELLEQEREEAVPSA